MMCDVQKPDTQCDFSVAEIETCTNRRGTNIPFDDRNISDMWTVVVRLGPRPHL